MKALLGRKIGMSQVFADDGRMIPVTALEIGPCFVVQVKTPEKEGYDAIQLGFDDQKSQRLNFPMKGHFAKAGVSAKKVLREVRLEQGKAKEYKPGQELRADIFKPGEMIDVVGTSKGKGTAGVMKRWNMRGAKASHGAHERIRHGGCAGQGSTPGRSRAGYHMPGRLGNEQVTVRNLPVVEVLPEQNVILVKGAVPGRRQSLLMVRSAVAARRPAAPSAQPERKSGQASPKKM